MLPHRSSIEPLEPRIAPATLPVDFLITGGKTASWSDVDGDLVTLKASKPVLSEDDFLFLDPAEGDIGQTLALLDLAGETVASGTALTFTAKRTAGLGDASVHIGRIDATGVDLGKVIVPGDLGSILAGDSNAATLGLASITVTSAAAFGTTNQDVAESPGINWDVVGLMGSMLIKGDFWAGLSVTDGDPNAATSLFASTGTLTIWGDVKAGSGVGGGFLFSEGKMGAVKIAGRLSGGDFEFAGSISCLAAITSVTIGDDVQGGTASSTGSIYAEGPLGKVTIGGDLVGGTSVETDVDGDVIPINFAGAVGSSSGVASVSVRGDVVGGYGNFSGLIYTFPESRASIGGVTIGGSLVGSVFADFSETEDPIRIVNGIYSDAKLGAVKVGAIEGRSNDNPASIVARGVMSPRSAADLLSIASVTVARSMLNGQILSGFDVDLLPVNPDSQIGPVKVGNLFVGSSIQAAGATMANAANNSFSFVSRIASVTIGGYAHGSGDPLQSFVISAETLGAVKIGGASLELTPQGPGEVGDDEFIVGSRNIFVFEYGALV